MGKPILCVDFDGVIHSYKQPWVNEETILDPPVPGALLFLYEATRHFRVCIYSSRSKKPEGIEAMKDWLYKYVVANIEEGYFQDDPNLLWLESIEYPTQKPAAFLTLDDRAICFKGIFPSISEMLSFRPWNKRTTT